MRNGEKYTTGDMQSMFGLTNKGLFHYEKKGIVAPTRLDNQYRVFTMEDCSRFFMSRIYRELGFSLDECVGLAERDLAEVTDCMHEREKALLGEARMLENLSREAGRLHGLMDRIARGDTGPREVVSEPMVRLESLHSPEGSAPKNADSFRKWFSYLPFSAASLSYRRESLTQGGIVQYSLGFIMERKQADALGVDLNGAVSELPARRCLYLIVEGSETGFDERERLAPALEALRASGRWLTADPYSRMIGVFLKGKEMLRYDELWCPI